MTTVLVVLLLTAFLLWFAAPLAFRRAKVRHLARLCGAHRAIVLSYDDGPGERTTDAVLDLLRQRGARATFFAIGREASARPAIIARLLAEGHDIGNHTQDHCNAWKTLPWVPPRDIREGRQSLDVLGAPPGPFRPPFGKMTLATLLHVWRTGEPVAFWTVDSRDSWENPRPVAEVLDMLVAQGGGVVLMHDCDSPPRARPGHDHRQHVLALTEAIIDLADQKAFAILRFGDLEAGRTAVPLATHAGR